MRKVKGRGGNYGSDSRPGLRKVEHIELSEKYFGLRLAAVILLLVISVFAFVYFVRQLVGTDIGWQEITASSKSTAMNVSGEFTFEYNIGDSGISAAQEKRKLASFYGGICENAYQIFNVDETMDGAINPETDGGPAAPYGEGYGNVYDLNHRVNSDVRLSAPLYDALKEILSNETARRLLYSGPLYEVMENLFSCETDSQAREFDPLYNDEIKGYFAKVNDFIASGAVKLELLADHKAVLRVSSDYLAFCEEYGVENIIDLYPFRNAFVIDYLAKCLRDSGYTNGILMSGEGCVQILDSEVSASFSIYELDGTRAFVPATASENRTENSAEAMDLNAMISLRSFPLEGDDRFRYYLYEDGSLRNVYLSEDGSCTTAVTNLIAAGRDGTCSGLVLSVLSCYIKDDAEELLNVRPTLAEQGVYTAFCQDHSLYSNIPNMTLTAGADSSGNLYEVIESGR